MLMPWPSLLDGCAVWDGNDCCRGPITNGALLAFVRPAAASLEGVEVIEQASPEGDQAGNGLAEVGVREVKRRLECCS